MKRSALSAPESIRDIKRRQREERQKELKRLEEEFKAQKLRAQQQAAAAAAATAAPRPPTAKPRAPPASPVCRPISRKDPPTLVEPKQQVGSPASSVSFSQNSHPHNNKAPTPHEKKRNKQAPPKKESLTAAERRRLRRKQQFASDSSSSSSDDDCVRRPARNKKLPIENPSRRPRGGVSSSDDNSTSPERNPTAKKLRASKDPNEIPHRRSDSRNSSSDDHDEMDVGRKTSLPNGQTHVAEKQATDSSNGDLSDAKLLRKKSPPREVAVESRQTHDSDEERHRQLENPPLPKDDRAGPKSITKSTKQSKDKRPSWIRPSSSSDENADPRPGSKSLQPEPAANGDSDDDPRRNATEKAHLDSMFADDWDSDIPPPPPPQKIKGRFGSSKEKAKAATDKRRRGNFSSGSSSDGSSFDTRLSRCKNSSSKKKHTRDSDDLESPLPRRNPLNDGDMGTVARNPLALSKAAALKAPAAVAAIRNPPAADLLWGDSSSGAEEESPIGKKTEKGKKRKESLGTKNKKKIANNNYDSDEDESKRKPDFAQPLFGPWELKPLELQVPEIEPDGLEEETDQDKQEELLDRRAHLAPIRERCESNTFQVPASTARYLGKYQQQGVQFMFQTVFQNGGGILGDGTSFEPHPTHLTDTCI